MGAGSLTGLQFVEGVGKSGVTFSKGGGGRGYNFHIKNKLKSEIFSDKESLYTKMFFSVTTKNSIQLLGRVHEKPMHRGDCFNKISLKKIITIASKLSPQVVNIDDGT